MEIGLKSTHVQLSLDAWQLWYFVTIILLTTGWGFDFVYKLSIGDVVGARRVAAFLYTSYAYSNCVNFLQSRINYTANNKCFSNETPVNALAYIQGP